jgi:hypothetical protein
MPSRYCGEVGVQPYSYMASATEELGGERHMPAALLLGKRPGTHCTLLYVMLPDILIPLVFGGF